MTSLRRREVMLPRYEQARESIPAHLLRRGAERQNARWSKINRGSKTGTRNARTDACCVSPMRGYL